MSPSTVIIVLRFGSILYREYRHFKEGLRFDPDHREIFALFKVYQYMKIEHVFVPRFSGFM